MNAEVNAFDPVWKTFPWDSKKTPPPPSLPMREDPRYRPVMTRDGKNSGLYVRIA